MSGCGRLEATITVASVMAQSLTITAIGGPYTVNIAAGDYTISALLTALQTGLNAASGADGTFTVTMNKTDGSGTGIITIAHTVETFTLTFGGGLHLLLGMASTLTPAALTFSGTSTAKGVWFPDSPISTPYGNSPGHVDIDRSLLISPGGVVRGFTYPAVTRRRLSPVRWTHVNKARAIAFYEDGVTTSFESWWIDTHGGQSTSFGSTPLVAIYSDSTADTLIGNYRLTDRTSTEVQQSAPPWDYLYTVEVSGYRDQP